jgi:hypothetical protein
LQATTPHKRRVNRHTPRSQRKKVLTQVGSRDDKRAHLLRKQVNVSARRESYDFEPVAVLGNDV